MMIGPPKKSSVPLDKSNPLTGKYDDFYSNAKVYDQKFGLVLTADNLRNPAKMSLSYGPDNFYPWRPFAAPDRSQKKDKAKQQWLASQFAIHIDVQHFKPNEIRIKVTGRVCNVKASHKDRDDDHGTVARKFEREFSLPKNIDVESVKSIISSDGVLTFKAARIFPEEDVTESPKVDPYSDANDVQDNKTETKIILRGESQHEINISSDPIESEEINGIEIPIQFIKEDEIGNEKKNE